MEKENKRIINAAGGLITNQYGGILLFLRRGFWDMPKGKCDPGESDEEAAIREVAEETGIHAILKDFITYTFHDYKIKGEEVTKRTAWFRMESPTCEIIPQTEEDISEARWVAPEAALQYIPMYKTIKHVIDTAYANISL